jgi:serine/threonine-protein kinase
MGQAGPLIVDGRYAIYDEIAFGGMATVHFGCALGASGPAGSKIVAIKRLHGHLAREHEFVTMFLDEARVAARIEHPNVAPMLDVVATEREVILVMEYVHGESLGKMLNTLRPRGERLPLPIIASILNGLLAGLHAAHDATDENGESLRIVHRDVSPQNVMVGSDGVARIVDFGIAKAVGRLQQTNTGEIKGKFGYMAPEQINGAPVTRTADIYAAGVVLWEALTGRRLFKGESDVQLAAQVLLGQIVPPSQHVPEVPAELDALVMRALEKAPERRFLTALEMARALRAATPVASPAEVAAWVEGIAGDALRTREARLREIEQDRTQSDAVPAKRSPAPAAAPSRNAPTARRRRHDSEAETQSGPAPAARALARVLSIPALSSLRLARIAPWAAVAVGVTIAVVALVSRRDDLFGAAAAPSATAAEAAGAAAPKTASSTAAPAPSTSATTMTVNVEALPVATPPSIPIEALPRAEQADPQANAAPKLSSLRPRRK